MAVLLSEIPESLAGEALPHKTWTRRELEVLENSGLLAGRFELIEGELIDKMGKKRKHVSGTQETARVLRALFGDDFVNTEAPIDVSAQDNEKNEPEPNVIVLRRPSRSLEGNPTAEDIRLLVEVADSTLRQDLTAKARLNARAGIPEHWVLDLIQRCLHVFRSPSGDSYQDRFIVQEGASVTPLEADGRPVAVVSLLP